MGLEIEIEEPPKPKPPPPSINNEISPRTQKIIKKTKKNENNNLLKSPQPPKEKKKSTKPRPQKKKTNSESKEAQITKDCQKKQKVIQYQHNLFFFSFFVYILCFTRSTGFVYDH